MKGWVDIKIKGVINAAIIIITTQREEIIGQFRFLNIAPSVQILQRIYLTFL